MTQTAAVQEAWLTILTDGARLLEDGQIEEAALVLAGLGPLCAPGAPKPTEEVATQARELLRRCYQAEAQQRAKLVDELGHLASGQKARVYRAQIEPLR
jgi:hypothetical protein